MNLLWLKIHFVKIWFSKNWKFSIPKHSNYKKKRKNFNNRILNEECEILWKNRVTMNFNFYISGGRTRKKNWYDILVFITRFKTPYLSSSQQRSEKNLYKNFPFPCFHSNHFFFYGRFSSGFFFFRIGMPPRKSRGS